MTASKNVLTRCQSCTVGQIQAKVCKGLVMSTKEANSVVLLDQMALLQGIHEQVASLDTSSVSC